MKKSRENITKEFLISQYKLGKEIREIAKELKCSTATLVLKNREFNISATDYNPKYMYKNKEWLEQQLQKYGSVSNVAKETGYPRTCISRYAEKYNLRHKKYIRNKNNFIDENYFENIDTENKTYFLGYIMADGNIYRYEDGRLQFSIKLKSTDKDIIYKFAERIKFDKDKIIFRSSKRKNTITNSVEIKTYNTVFCENLIKHGINPRKSGNEKIPNTIPKNLIKHFIRGFVDGDGSLSCNKKKTVFNVCSTSEDIISAIQKIFELDANIKINKYYTKNIYTLQSAKRKTVYLLCKYLYENSEIYLDRKYNIAMNIIEEYKIRFAL